MGEGRIRLRAADAEGHDKWESDRQLRLGLLRSGPYLDRFDSFDELLRQNLRDSVSTLRARRGAVVLVDEHTGKLSLRAAFTTASTVSGASQPFSQTLATRCFRGGQSL